MDGTVIIIVLAIAGVASVLLFAVKGLLDQVPDVIVSAARARDAWAGFRRAPSPPGGASMSSVKAPGFSLGWFDWRRSGGELDVCG
ncbi:hypothetical protein, partial [Streptomyces sp. NPDC045369]|uniref:hypothetical protein n=1 Tax=Streptomyces sp. NPDC045369 TaxID=3155732 RepID=UPI0033D7CCC1